MQDTFMILWYVLCRITSIQLENQARSYQMTRREMLVTFVSSVARISVNPEHEKYGSSAQNAGCGVTKSVLTPG